MPESNPGVPIEDSLLDAIDGCGDELVLGLLCGLEGGRATDKGEIIRSREGRWGTLPFIEEDMLIVFQGYRQVWIRRRASMFAITDGASWALGSALTRIGMLGPTVQVVLKVQRRSLKLEKLPQAQRNARGRMPWRGCAVGTANRVRSWWWSDTLHKTGMRTGCGACRAGKTTR